MKEFIAGQMYLVNGGGVIKVTRKTRCYLTFEIIEQPHSKPYRHMPGRRMYSKFGHDGHEVVLVPGRSIEGDWHTDMLCLAEHEYGQN